MKTLLKTILFVTYCVITVSCLNENELEPNQNFVIPYADYTLIDGCKIEDIKLYCLNVNEHLYGEDWWEKFARTKVVKNYSEIELLVDVTENHSIMDVFEDSLTNKKLYNRRVAFYKEKCNPLTSDYARNIHSDFKYSLPNFFAAYINEEVRITCDKALFGEAPGTNLTKYFAPLNYAGCLPVGVLTTELVRGFSDAPAETMDQLLIDEAWLLNRYYFSFKVYPKEKYDNITLHLEMPVKKEYVNDYLASEWTKSEIVTRFVDTSYKSDCKILFDWE